MYGVWYFAASMRAALATTVIVCFILATCATLRIFQSSTSLRFRRIDVRIYNLLGIYQLFTIFPYYNADIPEETSGITSANSIPPIQISKFLVSHWDVPHFLQLSLPFFYLLLLQ